MVHGHSVHVVNVCFHYAALNLKSTDGRATPGMRGLAECQRQGRAVPCPAYFIFAATRRWKTSCATMRRVAESICGRRVDLAVNLCAATRIARTARQSAPAKSRVALSRARGAPCGVQTGREPAER